MEIKMTNPITVLSAERMLTLPEVASASAELCPAMARDAERHGLTVDGPWIFVSHGLPKDSRTAFRIAFCLPVSVAAPYDGAYAVKTLEPMVCASGRHEGPLPTLFSDGYGPLLRAIEDAGHALSGESREIYHRWQGPDSAGNRIEIQFGLR
ncbi:hypothetical protein GDR74_05985 [Microvirga thermotolerans]|uniref:AraC family transcriptional regulator n=2 Tax=Microvirga thermotolerans TaxID=2651334 RepID=A0A5P9JT47_9HYPH|nr:hypothetical protein GDR74_05985 [Microvirga thermotolerans]